MSAVTQMELETLVMGALDARPMTAGSITRLLELADVDVKRSAVKRALERLVEKKRAGVVMAPCIRNGYMVQGRHYYDVELHHKSSYDDGDPFDGLA